MRRLRIPRERWARATLGLSLVFALAAFGYFALAGAPLRGGALAVLVLGAGYWEYRKKRREKRIARQYEAEAEAQSGGDGR